MRGQPHVRAQRRDHQQMKLFLYFSQIIGMDVIDANGEDVGSLYDIIMNPQAEVYPKATELVVRRGLLSKELARVQWADIAYIEEEARLKIPESMLDFKKGPLKCDFSLRRDILDQQVVDTD